MLRKPEDTKFAGLVCRFSMQKLGHWKSRTLRRGIDQWVDGPNSIEPQISAFLSYQRIYFSLLLLGGNVMISHTTGMARRHLVSLRYPPNITCCLQSIPKVRSQHRLKRGYQSFPPCRTYIGKVMAVPSYVRARNQNICVGLGLESGS